MEFFDFSLLSPPLLRNYIQILLDSFVEYRFGSLASFSDFALKELLRMPGVRGTRSSFIMQAVKSELAWTPIPKTPARRR